MNESLGKAVILIRKRVNVNDRKVDFDNAITLFRCNSVKGKQKNLLYGFELLFLLTIVVRNRRIHILVTSKQVH